MVHLIPLLMVDSCPAYSPDSRSGLSIANASLEIAIRGTVIGVNIMMKNIHTNRLSQMKSGPVTVRRTARLPRTRYACRDLPISLLIFDQSQPQP
jgi:hypothetical protein